MTATAAVGAHSRGLSSGAVVKWTAGAAVFAVLIVATNPIEDWVMPQADTQVKIGFGGSLVVMTVLFAYGVYGIAVRDGRGIAIGFGGAIASGVFAALLLAQQRHRER